MRHERIARRHQEGPDRPASRTGQGLRDRGPRVPGRGRGVRHARSPHRPLPRGRDARPVRPAPLLHRRPLREMGAGGRPGVSCERRRGRRAHLGDRARRRRRGAVVRRRPRRAVPQRRWRQELVAGARVVGRAGAAALESGRRRNVPQLDLPLARRCEAPGRQHLCRRRLADRRRRQELAAGRQGPGAALSARGGAPRHAHALRASHRARAAPALHPLHAVPRRRLSLRRRRRDVDRHRHRARFALRLRLPARHRPREPRPRLRHPAVGGHGPRNAGRPRARLRNARPGRELARARAGACRSRRPI